jgi:hypothetical protein
LSAARAELYSLPRPITLRFSRQRAPQLPRRPSKRSALEVAQRARAAAAGLERAWEWRGGVSQSGERRPIIRRATRMGHLQKEHRRSVLGQQYRASRYFILSANPGTNPGDAPQVLLAWTKSKAAAAAAFPALGIALNDADRFRMEKLVRKGDLESGSAVKVTTKILGAPGQLHQCTVERIGLNELTIVGEKSGSTQSRKLLVRASSNIARDGWYAALNKALEPMRAAVLPPPEGVPPPAAPPPPTLLHASASTRLAPPQPGAAHAPVDAVVGVVRRRQSIGKRRVSIDDAAVLADEALALSALISPATLSLESTDEFFLASPPTRPPSRAGTQPSTSTARAPLSRVALRGSGSTNRRNSAPSYRAFFASRASPSAVSVFYLPLQFSRILLTV